VCEKLAAWLISCQNFYLAGYISDIGFFRCAAFCAEAVAPAPELTKV